MAAQAFTESGLPLPLSSAVGGVTHFLARVRSSAAEGVVSNKIASRICPFIGLISR
jgi:hypothetical protein